MITGNQWDLLAAIAKEDSIKEPTSAEFIRNYNLSGASSVSLAIKSLLDKELIHLENENYYVSDIFFSNWLKNL